ncbi:MAG: hypothetical protein JJ971_08410 [Balneolaceae bacterium]|nr:hypothetical protein [Balneolaceae bacterium]MBO6546739.1 hypothetical protein [Balneolaceae bacterium]MBO6649097.1 hypothetical protein [Balneolaceae bacterium]
MKSSKKIISVLLLFACILSGIILAYTPSFVPNKITTGAELDSLIQLSLDEANLFNEHIRVYNIEMDSSFSRKVYRVRVPSTFSKTSFHLDLHERLYPMGFTSPTRVVFPERDMNIYVEHEGTIFRTIRMITDNSILNEE